jgi:hypothetical protein
MFEDYIFVPLDVPKLEFDRNRLLNFYDSKKVRITEGLAAPLNFPWNIVFLWERGATTWNEYALDYFPNLLEVFDQLPHLSIDNVALLEQLMEVKVHCDVSKEPYPDLGPASYRCMLINDEPSNTFYFRKGVRWEDNLGDSFMFPYWPETSNFFAMNNYNSMHGSFMLRRPESRKIMLTVWGRVDREKHFKLIARSIEKYNTYVIKASDA